MEGIHSLINTSSSTDILVVVEAPTSSNTVFSEEIHRVETKFVYSEIAQIIHSKTLYLLFVIPYSAEFSRV